MVVLICISLATNGVEHFFMCFLAIHIFSLEKCALSLPIFKLGYLSFYHWIVRIIYIFWIQVLYCMYNFKIFSSHLWVVYFLNDAFWSTNIFNFDEVKSFDFLCVFCGLCFDVISKKSLSNPKSMFPSKSFIVLPSTFRSMIHSEFIIMFGVT